MMVFLQLKTVAIEQKIQYSHGYDSGFIPADFYIVPNQNDLFKGVIDFLERSSFLCIFFRSCQIER